MTVTIEIPDEAAERVQAAAHAHGQDINTFATALVLDAADREEDENTYAEDVAALVALGMPAPGFAADDRLAREAQGDFRTTREILRDNGNHGEPRP